MITCHSAYGFERSTLLCAAPSSCKRVLRAFLDQESTACEAKFCIPNNYRAAKMPVSTLKHHEASGGQSRKLERRNAEWKELAKPSQESLDQDKWKSFCKSKKELNTNTLGLSKGHDVQK